jgi:hypothetical protein
MLAAINRYYFIADIIGEVTYVYRPRPKAEVGCLPKIGKALGGLRVSPKNPLQPPVLQFPKIWNAPAAVLAID